MHLIPLMNEQTSEMKNISSFKDGFLCPLAHVLLDRWCFNHMQFFSLWHSTLALDFGLIIIIFYFYKYKQQYLAKGGMTF